MPLLCCFVPSVREFSVVADSPQQWAPAGKGTAPAGNHPSRNREVPAQISTDSESAQEAEWPAQPRKLGKQQAALATAGHQGSGPKSDGGHHAAQPAPMKCAAPKTSNSSVDSAGTATNSGLGTQTTFSSATTPEPKPSRGSTVSAAAHPAVVATIAHYSSSSTTPASASPCGKFRHDPFESVAARLPPVRTRASAHTTWSVLQSTASSSMVRPASSSALLAVQSSVTTPAVSVTSRRPPAKRQQRWGKLGDLLRSTSQAGSDSTELLTIPSLLTAEPSASASGASDRSSWVTPASSSGGSSLLSASMGRVHNVRQLQPASSGQLGTAAAALADPAEAVCRQFAEQFIKALLTGNATWGSLPQVGSVFDEQCQMITHDGQVYAGRAAIIRRLNKGMEQFLKMLGVTGEEDEEAAAQMAAKAGKIETSIDVVNLTSAQSTGSSAGNSGLLSKLSRSSSGASLTRSASCNGPLPRLGSSSTGLAGPQSTVIVVTYTFKAGIRKFKLQDRFKVRQGLVVRLRRIRL